MFRHLLRGIKPVINKYNARKTPLFDWNRMASSHLDVEALRIVWIDMEMTGLDIENDKIMEVACLVTDADLNIVAEGPDLIIGHSKFTLDNMGEWCIKQHGKTGLTQACLDSNMTIEDAEKNLLEFVQKHTTKKCSPLGGSSIYMDRLFLRRFMPKLDDYLHYRIIDVSTIKELCMRFNPELSKMTPKKMCSHRAMGDIRESIDELKFYKDNFFRCS